MTRQIIIVVVFVCFVFTSSAFAGTWRDDFEDGKLDGWEGLDPFWTVEKGECSGEFAECCEIILTGSDWGKDYTVKCKMKFIGFPGCCAGINFRDIGDNAYTLFVVPSTNTIDGWKSPMISISKTPMPFVFSQDTWYEIEISIKGNNIEFYIDGKSAGKAKDDAPFPSGKVGFIVHTAHAHFDDLIVSGDGVENGGSWDPAKHPKEEKAVESKGKLAMKWGEIKSK